MNPPNSPQSSSKFRFRELSWLLIIASLLMGLAGPVLSAGQVDSPEFEQWLHQRIGTEWYGMYMKETKIGHASFTLDKRSEAKPPVWRGELNLFMQSEVLGDSVGTEINMVFEFALKAPYLLLTYHSTERNEQDSSRILWKWNGEGYEVKVTQGKDARAPKLLEVKYTLPEFMAIEWWIVKHRPEIGETMRFHEIDDEQPGLTPILAEIEAIDHTVAHGVEINYYTVNTIYEKDGMSMKNRISGEGQSLSLELGEFITFRLEAEELARNLDQPVDMFFSNLIKVDRPLGDPALVKTLRLQVRDAPPNLFAEAPGQRVTHDPDMALHRLELGLSRTHPIKATEQEIQEALKETLLYPIHHPRVKALARKAVGDAKTDQEKVERLVAFVYEYILSEYSASPLSVLSIIESRQGDCTEYSALFTTLARSLGIPTRSVGGLLYLDDEHRAFGFHEWNEVVLEGEWVAVDAAWNEVEINGTHIRTPVNTMDEIRMFSLSQELDLRVEAVEFHIPPLNELPFQVEFSAAPPTIFERLGNLLFGEDSP